MEKNKLIKYDQGELDKAGNSFAITNKLLAIKKTLPDLTIEETATSPYINFNASTGLLWIEGISMPVNPSIFYRPVFEWIDKYLENPQKDLTLRFFLKNVNTDTPKILLALLKHGVDKADARGVNCSVDWIYERNDEDILELGEYLKTHLEVPFNLMQNLTWREKLERASKERAKKIGKTN